MLDSDAVDAGLCALGWCRSLGWLRAFLQSGSYRPTADTVLEASDTVPIELAYGLRQAIPYNSIDQRDCITDSAANLVVHPVVPSGNSLLAYSKSQVPFCVLETPATVKSGEPGEVAAQLECGTFGVVQACEWPVATLLKTPHVDNDSATSETWRWGELLLASLATLHAPDAVVAVRQVAYRADIHAPLLLMDDGGVTLYDRADVLLDDPVAWRGILYQLACGLQALQGAPLYLVHGDCKMDNIVLVHEPKLRGRPLDAGCHVVHGGYTARLIDFGMAEQLGPEPVQAYIMAVDVPGNWTTDLAQFCTVTAAHSARVLPPVVSRFLQVCVWDLTEPTPFASVVRTARHKNKKSAQRHEIARHVYTVCRKRWFPECLPATFQQRLVDSFGLAANT